VTGSGGGGGCEPVVVATDAASGGESLWILTAGPTDLHYLTATGIQHVDADAVNESIHDVTGATVIASSSTRLVWFVPDDGLYRCSRPRCDDASQMLGHTESGNVIQILTDGNEAYWLTGPALSNGQIMRCTIDNCQLQVMASGQNKPAAIAHDATHVYWTNFGTGAPNTDGSIARVSKNAPGTAGGFVSNLTAPYAIGLSSSHLYWTKGASDGGVVRCELASNCASTEDLTPSSPQPINAPRSIVVEPTRFFWTNDADSTVMSCVTTGCPDNPNGVPEVLASGQLTPHAVVAGDTCLFWIDDTGGGRVMALPKP